MDKEQMRESLSQVDERATNALLCEAIDPAPVLDQPIDAIDGSKW
jgi:hypothetical protein